MYMRRGGGQNVVRKGLGAWYKAEYTFKGKGEKESESYDSPKQAYRPAGRFFKEKANGDHGRNYPGRRDAHIKCLYKNIGHRSSSSKDSIIRLISSISSLVGAFREVKAAIKAGREPLKVSVTKFSL